MREANLAWNRSLNSPRTLSRWFISWSLTREDNPLSGIELTQIVGHADFNMIRDVSFHDVPQWATAKKVKPAASAAVSESSAKSVPAKAAGAGIGSVLREIGSAPASDLLASYFKPYTAVGLGLIVLGALSYVFGGKGNGFALMGIGFAIGMGGASVIQYPVVSLMVPLAMGGLLVYAVYQLAKAKKVGAVLVETVQNSEHKAEIPGAIKERGIETEQMVRWFVDPIKAALAKGEGAASAKGESKSFVTNS